MSHNVTYSGCNITDNGTCPESNQTCKAEGLLLPILNESGWPIPFRAGMYMLGMIYCFLGISIVADVFMCAIEKITSRTRKIKIPNPEAEGGYEKIEVKVWNDAVANLTLMALGTSSPEILLSIIETVGNKFKAGDLGPGTIVGSAAFNLLVITAVCVVAIPSPEVRRISSIKVFAVTAIFSLFAYLWLIIVLVLISPNVLEVWEAILTFLYFPILVILAYIADKDPCGKKDSDKNEPKKIEFGGTARDKDGEAMMPLNDHGVDGFDNPKKRRASSDSKQLALSDGHVTKEKMREFVKDLQRTHPELSEEEIAQLAATKMAEQEQHSRLWYRINATRSIGGNPRLVPSLKPKLLQAYGEMKDPKGRLTGSTMDLSDGGRKTIVEFVAAQSSVLEKEGKITVVLRRYGRLDVATPVRLETIDGTAEAGSDYNPVRTILTFEKGDTHKSLDIGIIDDDICEPDEMFFVKLSLLPDDLNYASTAIGHLAIHEVTIIDDDKPGVFEFHKPSMVVKESVGSAMLTIVRNGGADGRIVLKWKTTDITAVGGKDYEGGEGELVFAHGESTKELEIKIIDDGEFEKDEHFKVELTEVDGGAEIGKTKQMVVTIVNDDDFKGMVGRLVNMTNVNVDMLKVDSMSWRDQFRNAMNVNGGDVESATSLDYLMHFLTFGWKIIFAMIPPPSICGGWPSFFCALTMIGLLTAIVGDMATIFGCLVGLDDAITAITFVAVGTSVPDLFASKTAAVQEKTADNSIGNVTGSNSVNVFLGMGLPWMIASIYWAVQGEPFIVQAGALRFSVTIYLIVAVLCLGVLMLKRSLPKLGLGELGGPAGVKWMSAIFFVCLWLIYVILSSLQVKKFFAPYI